MPGFVFIHPLNGLEDDRTDAAAAFGDGMATRKHLLNFLPLRSGLLSLRAASKATRALCCECSLKFQSHSFPPEDLFRPASARAVCAAFPRATDSLNLSISRGCTPEDVAAIASIPNVKVFLIGYDDLMNSPALANICKRIVFPQRLKAQTTEQLAVFRGVEEVWLNSKRGVTALGLLLSDGCLPRLDTLVVANSVLLQSDILASDFLPFGARLHKLVLHVKGLRLDEHLREFSQLKHLEVRGGTLDAQYLPSALETLQLNRCTLVPACFSLPPLTCLSSLSLASVQGLEESWLETLPESVTSLQTILVVYTWASLRALGNVKRLQLYGTPAVPTDAAEARAVATVLAGLESLQLQDFDYVHLLPAMPSLRSLDIAWYVSMDNLPEQIRQKAGEALAWVQHHTPALQRLQMGDISQADLLTTITRVPSLREVDCSALGPASKFTLLRSLQEQLTDMHGPKLRLWGLFRKTQLQPEFLHLEKEDLPTDRRRCRDSSWIRLTPSVLDDVLTHELEGEEGACRGASECATASSEQFVGITVQWSTPPL